MNIVVLGQTGSGKTTLTTELAAKFGLAPISSGTIARRMAQEDAHTAVALDKGLNAPEEAMRLEVKRELEAAELTTSGWILEGFPRMMPQLVCLMQWTATMPTFVYLEMPDLVCIERLIYRSRADDTADSIARRVESFHEKTMPVITTLENGGILHTIRRAHEQRTVDIIAEIAELAA